ncbi:MAG: hypothetical protein DRH11_01775 [Deltaproteobacteria bacterium]|nr:MAG: hypothetical protein DRH11_01775 [Deltaproteobacteria bacterium]
MRKPEEQSARSMLIAAGINLFAEKGYASASVREIVKLAGVTKPVLYYYFKNKEGLFRAILDGAAEQQEALLAKIVNAPGTALERIITLYNLIYQGMEQNRHLFRLIHNLVFGPPQGAPAYDLESYHRRMVEAIKAIYVKGVMKGELARADPDEVAIMVTGLTDFCFHLYYVDPGSFDPNLPERLLRLAFKGLLLKSEDE